MKRSWKVTLANDEEDDVSHSVYVDVVVGGIPQSCTAWTPSRVPGDMLTLPLEVGGKLL